VKRNGPPKTPTSLKIIRGTFRKDRAMVNEPKPQPEIPCVPAELSDQAKVEWGRLSQELATLGLLSRIDRAALAVYCEAWSDWLDATMQVRQYGKVIKTTAGNVVDNPYYSIKKRSAELMHKFLTEFGMTPASRTRIDTTPVTDDHDREQKKKRFFG
jgi:P27 family predicted phage terminase small subunit